MTMKELNDRLAKLVEQEFYLQMKDRWTPEDYVLDRKMHDEMLKIKDELKELLK